MKNKAVKLESQLILPEPTFEDPYVQLDWIWGRFMRRYRQSGTLRIYRDALTAYKKFLREHSGFDERLKNDSRFYLSVHWDLFAVYNAAQGWQSFGLKLTTVRGYTNMLIRVIDFASGEGLTNGETFIPATYVRAKNEAKANEAYSEPEIELIRKIITRKINHTISYIRGYQRTGVGKDPRTKGRNGKRPTEGWKCWENIVWYFENVLNCDPELTAIHTTNPLKTKDPGFHFSVTAGRLHGGIEAVRERLGIARFAGISLISPLIIRLALETGLNPESICNLKRDCFQNSHILTGLPYLRYYKERSNGEKVLHLSLLDEASSEKNGVSILHLVPRQSEIVRRTIELILQLTEPIVTRARNEDRDFLLLCETTKPDSPVDGDQPESEKRVIRCNLESVKSWFNIALDRLKKEGINVNLDKFTLSRFRSTKITQMVREGHDFFRIQAVAGHASPRTTVRYLAKHQIAPQIRREIRKTLIQIHRNRQEYENQLPAYAMSQNSISKEQNHPEGVIYKGVISDCRNVFDPPNTVKALVTYSKGDPCTYWNMCLFCPNIIITRRHLPLIIKYAEDILASCRGGNLAQVPNIAYYRKTLEIIEGILAEFPEGDVAWAKQEAGCQDLFLDTVLYRGVIK